MKNNLRTMGLSILAASVLAACGGGGGGTPAAGGGTTTPPPGVVVTPPPTTGGTPTTATALSAIAAQLTVFQGRFATAMPAANDATLSGLLDATFLQDGQNKAAFLVNITTAGNGLSIGDTFTAPVSTTSLDAGAVANDATHQWFATAIKSGGGYFKMLAIKNAAGKWLLAGNQRQVGLRAVAEMMNTTASTVVVFNKNMKLNLEGNGGDAALLAMGITSATVSGPGVVGATVNTPGAATIFTSTAPVGGMAGSQQLLPCGAALTTNCVNMAAVAAGTYSFVVTKAGFNYTYNEAFAGSIPATLSAAMFPVINPAPATTPLTGYTSGATVKVNWTVPAAQSALGVNWFGTLSNNTNINMFVNALGGAGVTITSSTTLPIFPAGATLLFGNINACSMDANAVQYCTQQ